MKIGFAGFRHAHVDALYRMCERSPEIQIVGAWEGDARARAEATERLGVRFTHATYQDLLSSDAEAIAIGDAYGHRGQEVIQALSSGRHVIADKPVCTRLSELIQIESLVRARSLKVGCMLDLRELPAAHRARELIQSGALGRVHTIYMGGQHPLLYGQRPAWYFEEGMHGGTINDLAVHGLDLVAFMTGMRVSRVLAARCWNGFATQEKAFKDCAQFMLEMDGCAGLLGDVSYSMPNGCGYGLPLYWRFTLLGEGGAMEFSAASDEVRLARADGAGFESYAGTRAPTDFLRDFLADVRGESPDLHTDAILRATRDALTVQAAAE